MDKFYRDIIDRIQSGEIVEMDDSIKNLVNSILADSLEPGDKVRAIRTGKVGIVTRKIPYDRNGWASPYGYTAIQVDIDGRRYSYAARSLQKVKVDG